MENLINSTATVLTIAPEVRALLADTMAKLAALAESVAPEMQAHKAAYHSNDPCTTPEQVQAWEELKAEHELFFRVEDVFKVALNNLEHRIADIDRGIEERTKAYEGVEWRKEWRLKTIRKQENERKAETIERIESDFFKISGSVETEGRGKNKRSWAKLIFQLNGTVYQTMPQINIAEGTFFSSRLGLSITDLKTTNMEELFSGDMDDEAVAKAAHALDCIRAELNQIIGKTAPAAAA